MYTVDCIQACSLSTIFSEVLYVYLCTQIIELADICRSMPADALKLLVQALLDHLPKESSPIVVKPDRSTSGPIRTNGHQSTTHGISYDPSVVYLLELATIIALRDSDTIAAVGESVADALQNVVRDASNVHSLIVSRAVYYLLHLLNASQVGFHRTASELKH